MALTIAITQSIPGRARADDPVNFNISVTNTASSAVTLQNLSVSPLVTGNAVQIIQPIFTLGNQPPGVGNAVLLPNAAQNFPFTAVFLTPNIPGKSPQAVGGAAGQSGAFPTKSAVPSIVITAQASDGSITTAQIQVPVLSAVSPFPVPEGGALQFKQGRNAALAGSF